MCAGNTIIPTEEEISKRKVARIRQTTETLETLIVVENRDTCRKILRKKLIFFNCSCPDKHGFKGLFLLCA